MKSRSSISGRAELPGQMELPQTEARLGDLLQRKADASLCAPPRRWVLKPSGAWEQEPAPVQAPCDHGLFSDQAAQADLLQLLKP